MTHYSWRHWAPPDQVTYIPPSPTSPVRQDALMRIIWKEAKPRVRVFDTHLVDIESLGFVKPCRPVKQH